MKTDFDFLAEATALAWKSYGHVRPNPPVGALVVKDGAVVGRGRHRRCGGDHAEVDALKRAGARAKGATVYCTLEPCSKPGRVGACTEALAAAGVKRVVWAVRDPNPVNRGKAARVLRRAGIAAEHVPYAPAERLVAAFAKHVATRLPYVTVKIALSLDGRICDDAGNARWISSARARAWTDRFRRLADVVLVGAETVRKDDPSLLCHGARNDDLWRAVVSKSGRLPKNAQIFTDAAKDRTLVYRDAAEAVRDLGRRGFTHVLCEGGLELARSLAAGGFVDEWVTVLAPKVIGHGPIAEAVSIPRTFVYEDAPCSRA